MYGYTFLKTKAKFFFKFLEWKSMVEKSSGEKIKTLRSDNGGEYTSKEFEDYLKKEWYLFLKNQSKMELLRE